MESDRTEVASVALDVGLIGAVVRELAGAHRNVSSYPQGHPVVVQACERAAEMLARVCANREGIALGVARETLLVGESSLGTLVPAVRNFTRTLAHHGVALITFRKGVTAAEIEGFSQILAEKRAEISAKGGIGKVVHGAGIRNLEVCEIQYDAFQAVGIDSGDEGAQYSPCCPSLWETFVSRLLQGMEDSFPADVHLTSPASPKEVAGLVNSQSHGSMPGVIAVLEELLRESGGAGQLSPEEKSVLEKIGEFVGGLKPELRQKFFDSVLKFCQQQDFSLLEVMPYLPPSAALELLTRSQENEVVLPSHIIDSMEQLAEAFMDESTLGSPVRQPKLSERDEGLHIVFREDIVNEFVPVDYLETLKTLVSSQKIPEPSRDDFQELTSTLMDDRIESAVSRIILESLASARPEQLLTFKHNLHELCLYFLEVGDFHSLENMYVRLSGIPFENEEVAALKLEVLETFHGSEFIAEVLNGVDSWGKDKFEEIGVLIQGVGKPFVGPLLDRLADEENLTLRRYLLEQLLKMSDRAKEAVYARLGDHRWYFLRNLVIILAHSGDPEVLVHLRKVAGFPHPKVRQRVIEAFLSFGDPEGDRLLLQDLMSQDNEVRQSAIQQAGKTRSAEVIGALLLILEKKGMSPLGCMEKKSIIQALAETGDSRVLPVFARMLTARHFLRLSLWKTLKKEILNSLVKYSDPFAMMLVQKVATSGNSELANFAARLIAGPGDKG